jgi:branched-chain amino acid aminotransferase
MSHLNYYNLDGKLFLESENNISVNNRSFRYGDGFFETIKLVDGNIQLKELHFERIATSLATLGFVNAKHFSFDNLEKQIVELATKNNHQHLGRIRITFYRADAGLYEVTNFHPHILIQSFELNETVNKLNENGLVIDVYPLAKKSCDVFSNIKSNNYLQYAMAAIWAKENKINDALLLNSNNSIADSTIANVFIVKNSEIKTPALTEGCVAGVMRKHIIETLKQQNIIVAEMPVNIEDIANADEVFLTNAIKGIMWVRQFKDTNYANFETKKIYQKIKLTK